MGRYFFRFMSNTLVSFETAKDQQHSTNPIINVSFPALKSELVLYDSLDSCDGVWLHKGIGLDMYVECETAGSANQIATGLAENVLALMSLSQLSPAFPAKLVLTYDASRGLQKRPFRIEHSFRPTVPTLSKLREIDPDLFLSVFSGLEHLSDRSIRAIQWFRKGLMETHTLDEFASYWIALEISAAELKKIAGKAGDESYFHCERCHERLTPCPKCKTDTGRESDWAGLFKFLEGRPLGLGKSEFNAIRKFRGGLLHGGSSLSDEKVEAIKQEELKDLRVLAVLALGTILRVPFAVTQRIAAQNVHRIVTQPTVRMLGELEMLSDPPELWEVRTQPTFAFPFHAEKFSITPEGKISVNVPSEVKCFGAQYTFRQLQLWGDQNAGVTGSVEVGPPTSTPRSDRG
jgi:hypothetical protein